MTNKIILKELEAERERMVNDCWKYHGKKLKEDAEMNGEKLTKAGLLTELFNLDIPDDDDERYDIFFFTGYFRALNAVEKYLRKESKKIQ